MSRKRTSRSRRDESRPDAGRPPYEPHDGYDDLLDEYLKARIRKETFRGADGSTLDGSLLLERLYDRRRPRSRRRGGRS